MHGHSTRDDWNYLKAIESYFKVQTFANNDIISRLIGQHVSLTFTQLLSRIKTSKLTNFLANKKIALDHPLSYELTQIDKFFRSNFLAITNHMEMDPKMVAEKQLQISNFFDNWLIVVKRYNIVQRQASDSKKLGLKL